MKQPIVIALTLMLGAFLALPSFAQTFQAVSSDASIQGTSNVHDWESEVTQVFVQGDFTFADNRLTDIRNLSVRVPVKGIESAKGRIMDNKTYDALDADNHPNIRFTMTNVGGISNQGNTANIRLRGNLTIAGATRAADLTATATYLPDGQIRVQGSKTLKMTDFGIEPPTALLGTMTVGDSITFQFEVLLGNTNGSASR